MTLFLARRHSIKQEDVARDSPSLYGSGEARGASLKRLNALQLCCLSSNRGLPALSQMRHWTTKPQWFVTLPLTCVKRFLGRDRN